jgi:hypothetical protein
MAGKSIEITGLSKILRITDKGAEVAKQAIAQGLYLEAQMAFNESQTLVPIDTGILRTSGHITSPKVTPESVEITIAYGGPATDYAYIVHERIYAPSGKKVYHKPPTRAKYLETPVKRRSKGMGKRLTTFVHRAIGRI